MTLTGKPRRLRTPLLPAKGLTPSLWPSPLGLALEGFDLQLTHLVKRRVIIAETHGGFSTSDVWRPRPVRRQE